jgi:hypothetical protein
MPIELIEEINRTGAGHWHPDHVECSIKCPMGDPLTRDLFRAAIDRAQAPLLRRLLEVSA